MFHGEFYWLASIALVLWIPLSQWLFGRERAPVAAAHTMVWAAMWLPNGAVFDFPVLPPIGKFEIASMLALLGVWRKAPRRLKAARIGRGVDWVIWISMLLLWGTVEVNPEALRYGKYDVVVELPAFVGYDGMYAAFEILFGIMIPMWIGRAILRTRQDLLDLLSVLSVAGAIYSIPIMWELRMSPQLQASVYGFVDHADFSQNMRAGGFRSVVFMGHGLIVAFFEYLAFTSTLLLSRFRRSLYGVPSWVAVALHFILLVFCRSAGATIFGLATWLVFKTLKPRAWVTGAVLLSLLVACYPISRITDIFPTQAILDFSNSTLGPERTQSMQFRFDNEDLLLIKGQEKFWFGWGGFSRENVFDDFGKRTTVQDGYWVAVFGTRGLLGFLTTFFPMVWVVFGVRKRMSRMAAEDRWLLGGAAWMLGICNVNVIPNMSLPNLHLILAMGVLVLSRSLVVMPKKVSR